MVRRLLRAGLRLCVTSSSAGSLPYAAPTPRAAAPACRRRPGVLAAALHVRVRRRGAAIARCRRTPVASGWKGFRVVHATGRLGVHTPGALCAARLARPRRLRDPWRGCTRAAPRAWPAAADAGVLFVCARARSRLLALPVRSRLRARSRGVPLLGYREGGGAAGRALLQRLAAGRAAVSAGARGAPSVAPLAPRRTPKLARGLFHAATQHNALTSFRPHSRARRSSPSCCT
jgi:hypothetical protein